MKAKIIPKKKSKTVVSFILDETGSMISRKGETVRGVNEFIQSMKKEKGDVVFSLTKFGGTRVQLSYDKTEMKKVKEFTETDYHPDGMTPLYDAVGKTIRSLEKEVKKNDKVVFVILTDGEENASKEYNTTSIKALIKEKEDKDWKFTYVADKMNGRDASLTAASSLGIAGSHTMTYDPNNTVMTWSSMTAGVSSYAQSATRSTTGRNFFNTGS